MSPRAAFYLGLHWVNPGLTLCILKIPKRGRWQTVKTQVNCIIIMVCTIQHPGTEIYHNLENSTCEPLKYTMCNPIHNIII